MGDGNLEHGIRRHGKETRLFAGDFDEEGKNVEGRAGAGRGPTGLEEARGEVYLRGITQHGAVGRAVTGIADKLVIVDARPGGVRPRGGENGDERLDASAIGRAPEVGDTGFENSLGRGDVPCVDHLERLPETAPDAAAAVAPGEAAGEGEFFRGLPVEAAMPDFFGRLYAAGDVRGGVVLTRKLIEKGMRSPDRIGGVARFVGEERGVVGREAPATKGTLRGDVHFIRVAGWKGGEGGRPQSRRGTRLALGRGGLMVSGEVSSARKSLRFVSGRGCHRRRHGPSGHSWSEHRVWAHLGTGRALTLRCGRGITRLKDSMTPCQCRHEREHNGKVNAVIIPRLAASHGLIAYGDLSGDDFVYWRHEFAILRMAASHGLIAWSDLSEGGCAGHGIESAILRMAASHGFEP